MSSFYFASGLRSTQHKEYDAIPIGSNFTEFYSRPVEGSLLHSKSDGEITRLNSYDDEDNSLPLQKVAPQVPELDPPIGSLILKRKVPLKADPKAMLAVERTFMQWMHTSLWLLSASLTIMKFSGDDPIKFIYGALIIPVALTFTLYSLYQCEYNDLDR